MHYMDLQSLKYVNKIEKFIPSFEDVVKNCYGAVNELYSQLYVLLKMQM